MTTCAYRLKLDDSEAIMLEAALKMMIDRCDKELMSAKENNEDPKPPFIAFKRAAQEVLKRINSDTELTSFSNVNFEE